LSLLFHLCFPLPLQSYAPASCTGHASLGGLNVTRGAVASAIGSTYCLWHIWLFENYSTWQCSYLSYSKQELIAPFYKVRVLSCGVFTICMSGHLEEPKPLTIQHRKPCDVSVSFFSVFFFCLFIYSSAFIMLYSQHLCLRKANEYWQIKQEKSKRIKWISNQMGKRTQSHL
jgi:hypothetical protein